MQAVWIGFAIAGAMLSVAQADPPIAAGADFELLPAVRYESSAPPFPTFDNSGPTAYAAGVLVEWRANSVFSIGFAPRLLFGIAAGGGPNESDHQLDLLVRLAAGTNVRRDLRVFGYVAPGYSALLLSSSNMPSETFGSLAIGAGAGASFTLSPRLAVTAELGYQLVDGFKNVALVGPGDTLTLKDDYLSLALGLVTPL